jgi:hypothetical protein
MEDMIANRQFPNHNTIDKRIHAYYTLGGAKLIDILVIFLECNLRYQPIVLL